MDDDTIITTYNNLRSKIFRHVISGVWFMHCHIDLHTSWGMSMAFIVKNGRNSDQILPPPPPDMPPC